MQQIIFTDEAGNKWALRLFVERFRRGDLLNPTAAKDSHPVRQHHRLLLVVGHVDDRDPQATLDAPDFILHFLTQTAIKGAERFVHQHQARFKHQRPGNGHALLLAAGQLAGTPLLKSFQADKLQHAPDALPALLRVNSAYLQRKRQIAADRHVRKQRVVLKDHADTPLARRQVVHRATVDADGARCGRLKAGQHHQAGGFARPGGAEQGQKLPFAHAQIEITHNLDSAVVALAHALECDVGVFGCIHVAVDPVPPVCRASRYGQFTST